MKKNNKKSRKVFWIVFFLFFLLCIFGLLFRLSFFDVKGTKFEGVSFYQIESLQDFFANYYIDNQNSYGRFFLSGKNIFLALFDKNKIEENIKNEIKVFENVVVKVSVFRREISVFVKERKIFGVFCEASEEENCFWFDRDGFLFAKAPNLRGNLIYKVVESGGTDKGEGDFVVRNNYIENFFKIFDFIELSGIETRNFILTEKDLAEMRAEKTEITPEIYFSLITAPDFALEGVKEVDKKTNNLKDVEYIDLRVRNRIYYK